MKPDPWMMNYFEEEKKGKLDSKPALSKTLLRISRPEDN